VPAKPRKQLLSRSRIDRLRLSFSKLRADALLVSSLPNIQYLCGFSGSAGILLVEPGRSTLFTDSRYTFQARQEVHDARVVIAPHGLVKAVAETLKARKTVKRIAYSQTNLSVAQQIALASAAGSRIRWLTDADVVQQQRAVKDAAEIALIKDAAVLISQVFEQTLPFIRPVVTELELAAEIEYRMKKLGASGPSFETIVACGSHSAWAHAKPTSKQLKAGDLVVLDQGAILRSYCSDMTRTVFVGRASKRIRELYQAVLEAQAAGKAAIRPGVTAGEVDAATRGVLRRFRFDRYFTHSTGHGLGLEVHETPRIGRGETTILQEGMVVTVEPGVYLEGVGGIRIEDDVLVTAQGSQDLTTAPREFLEL
jgi:Xaa-Pro aminopeptidase